MAYLEASVVRNQLFESGEGLNVFSDEVSMNNTYARYILTVTFEPMENDLMKPMETKCQAYEIIFAAGIILHNFYCFPQGKAVSKRALKLV